MLICNIERKLESSLMAISKAINVDKSMFYLPMKGSKKIWKRKGYFDGVLGPE